MASWTCQSNFHGGKSVQVVWEEDQSVSNVDIEDIRLIAASPFSHNAVYTEMETMSTPATVRDTPRHLSNVQPVVDESENDNDVNLLVARADPFPPGTLVDALFYGSWHKARISHYLPDGKVEVYWCECEDNSRSHLSPEDILPSEQDSAGKRSEAIWV